MTTIQTKVGRFLSLVAAAALAPSAQAMTLEAARSQASSAVQAVGVAVERLGSRAPGLARLAATREVASLCGVADPPANANLDAQLAWAESVADCLSAHESALKTLLVAESEEVRRTLGPLLPVVAASVSTVNALREELAAEKDFLGDKWGLAVGYSHGFDDIVDTATVVDGVVRVTKDLTDQPRVLFEFHNYRWCHKNRTDNAPIKTGCGPFAAIASSDDEVVSGVAVGWMYGWKSTDPKESTGFSVGLGVILDAEGKELAEGYVEGQPPPTGVTTVQLKEESVWSAVLFVTRTF